MIEQRHGRRWHGPGPYLFEVRCSKCDWSVAAVAQHETRFYVEYAQLVRHDLPLSAARRFEIGPGPATRLIAPSPGSPDRDRLVQGDAVAAFLADTPYRADGIIEELTAETVGTREGWCTRCGRRSIPVGVLYPNAVRVSGGGSTPDITDRKHGAR